MKTRMGNVMLVTMLPILLTGLSGSRTYGATVTWTGSGNNDNWSNGNNWLDCVPPAVVDSVVFDATDTGNINVVDIDFTIAGLQYIGDSVHTTDLNGSSNLQINGAAKIGVGHSGSGGAAVTWTNGGAVAIGSSTVRQDFAIGHSIGVTADTTAGSLLLEGTSVDAFVEGFVIGHGSLVVGENSRLHIDSSGWWIDIGSNSGGDEDTKVIGVLDTRFGEAELQAHTMSIGFASAWSWGKANGKLMLGSNDSVRANIVFVGIGTHNEAKGVLEAVEGDPDFRVGALTVGSGSTGHGVLRWDQSNPLYAESITFGHYGVGILDVPEGGTCRFGSETEPVSNMMLGYLGIPTVEGFDFTVRNPVFEAYLDNLSIGTNQPEGSSLILGSNSKLRIGQLPNFGYGIVSIGVNLSIPDATGLLDTVRGDAEIHVSTFDVGRTSSWGAGGGAYGTFTMGSDNVVTASYGFNVGMGTNATGTVNLMGGMMGAHTINMGAGGTFNFTDGRLAVNTFNTFSGTGTLEQQGGTLAPGFSLGFSQPEISLPGRTVINGNYDLTSAGTLEIELFGLTGGSEYDQMLIYGQVNLNADLGGGSILDLVLDFAPQVGNEFVIIDNDLTDPILGSFAGLSEGSLFSKTYLDQIFTFQISYLGHTGNDVVLRVDSIQPSNEQPMAVCQDVVVSADENCLADASIDDGSYDPDGDPITMSQTPAGPYSLGDTFVTLTVTDPYGESDSCTATVTVVDVSEPVITSLMPDSQVVAVGSPAIFTVVAMDNCSCALTVWQFDVENPLPEEFTDCDDSVSHTYTSPGIYTVGVVAIDATGNMSDPAFVTVVVYDPTGGFVTGGGWIESPVKPEFDYMTVGGKANFGFISKYKKGAVAPTGQTEFMFKAGDLNFHSTSYDWLVVTGSDYARFKGTGTINGSGEYKFMLWAGDGNPDTFRIKIWTEDDLGNETVVYDNGFDQAIGGGSIVIHTK